MKKRFVFFAVLVVFLIVFLMMFPWVLRGVGTSLIYETDLKKSDAIVVLAGAGGSRVRKAVELYHQGIASTLVMTGNVIFNTSYPQLMKDYAVELGVSSDHIILEEASYSTYDHGKHLKAIFEQHQIRSFTVVTSLFHTKRSLLVFSSLFESPFQVQMVGADDGVNYEAWWRSSEMIEKVAIEWQKLVWYRLFYL